MLTKLEETLKLSTEDAAKLMGMPYSTYMRNHAGKVNASQRIEFHVEDILDLSAKALKDKIQQRIKH
jgi:predicted transcriptional regulator